MAIVVTLDDIRSAAEKRYGDVEVPLPDGSTCVLRNALKLSDKERDEISTMQNKINSAKDDGESVDQRKFLEDMLVTLAATKAQGRKLVTQLGGDLTLLASMVHTYQESTQMGEASPSQD